MDGDTVLGGIRADIETELEIQRFLADEAAILDDRDYRGWFGLLTDDIVYRIATQVVRRREAGLQEVCIVDETRDSLKLRIDQLSDPRLTRAENPPSMYRRFVTNVRSHAAEPPGSYSVEANLLVYKNRPSAGTTELYAATRRDTLRRVDGALRISARHVRLDQSVLAGGTLSTIL